MPKIIGTSQTVVDHDGLLIDELAGNVATQQDTLSIAKVTVSKATSEPWLTLEYDEWICVVTGVVELHSSDQSVLTVREGETVFVGAGERFRPVFPGPCEYIPVCLPAFKPERCHREEENGTSEVSAKQQKLLAASSTKTNPESKSTNDNPKDRLYHMCQKKLWDEAVSKNTAYYPPTFEQDGGFIHATAVPARLLATANHFYTETPGEWICLALSQSKLHQLGIVTRLEEPKAVGSTETDNEWNEWRCPHIFGGIPMVPGVLIDTFPMVRNDQGTFLTIEGLT